MMSTNNLVKLAKQWRSIAASSRKRISLPRTNKSEKGQFVVYTIDDRRYLLPMACLQSRVVMELLRMAGEEFGLGGDGRITLPCDSVFMEYAIYMIQQSVATEMEEALITSLSQLRTSNSASTHMFNDTLPISCC